MISLKPFSLVDFYKLAIDFVAYQKAGDELSARLQTFAVLSTYNDLNSPNLGKTRNEIGKPFFWSRKWARNNYNPSVLAFDYPLLAVHKVRDTTLPSIANPTSYVNHSIEVYVAYKYNEAAELQPSEGLDSRNRPEHYIEAKENLKQFFKYLSEVELYEEGAVVSYCHPSIAILKGIDANIVERGIKPWRKRFMEENQLLESEPWDGSIDNTSGAWMGITIPELECVPDEVQWENIDFTIGYDRHA